MKAWHLHSLTRELMFSLIQSLPTCSWVQTTIFLKTDLEVGVLGYLEILRGSYHSVDLGLHSGSTYLSGFAVLSISVCGGLESKCMEREDSLINELPSDSI